jgi:hypothetical protein
VSRHREANGGGDEPPPFHAYPRPIPCAGIGAEISLPSSLAVGTTTLHPGPT